MGSGPKKTEIQDSYCEMENFINKVNLLLFVMLFLFK